MSLTRPEHAQYQSLIDNAHEVLYALDLCGHFTFVNRAVESIAGYTSDELLGSHISTLLAPGEMLRTRAMLDAKLDGRATTTYELDIIAKDGRRVPVEVSTRLLFEDGRPIGVQGIARDISERRQLALQQAELTAERIARQFAEHAAERSAGLQRLTAALSRSLTPGEVASVILREGAAALGADAGAVALLTEDGESLELVRSVGYRPDLVERWRRFSLSVRTPAAEAVRTNTPIFLQSIEECCAGHAAFAIVPLEIDGRVVGAIAFGFSVSRVFEEEDRSFAIVLGRQCAQALERARLFDAERMARAEADAAARTAQDASRLKDEFLATLSHELRTPLNAVVGWARLLKEGRLDAATATRAVETIERNALVQAELIEELLDHSRAMAGKLLLEMATVDLNRVAFTASETVGPAAQAKSIAIQLTCPAKPSWVRGDVARLRQAICNLLSNAVKFTPAGGTVVVSVEQRRGEIELRVSDTGVGIPPEFLPYVFDRFRQADNTTTRTYGGLGLGLAIVRHVIERHGGTVAADSKGRGHGSVFAIKLPAVDTVASDTSVDGDSPSRRLPSLEGLRVLVVDDDADAGEVIEHALAKLGAEIHSVRSADEAVFALQIWRPDVLLADIGMPVEDGYTLIRRVRELAGDVARIPAAALTAYADAEARLRTIQAGYEQHFAKPIDTVELASAVAALARRHSPT